MAVKTFATGEVFTASDTNTYLANAGLVYVTSTTFTNVASVQVDNCFTSTYDAYRVLIELYSSSTSARYAFFRLVDGTTPSTASYLAKAMWADIGANTAVYVASDARTDRGCLGPIGYANNGEGSYDLDIHYPKAAKNTRVEMTGQGLYAGAYFTGVTGWCLHTTTTAFEGIQVFPTADNISGEITVFGYRKA